MSRRVSIFSVVVVMTVTVLATVAVALAQEEPLDEPQNESGGGPVEKVSLCHKPEHKHNGHTITVGAPAVHQPTSLMATPKVRVTTRRSHRGLPNPPKARR